MSMLSQRNYPPKDNPQGGVIDGMTREEVCHRFQGRIMLLARRLADRLPSGSELTREDLASCGAIGLLEAIDRFDETRNIQFSTYAEYRIRGAMMDALRACDTFSRHRRKLARRIQDGQRAMALRLGRQPEPEEVAEHLDMSLEEYWEAVHRVAPVSYVSLDDTEGPDGDDDGRALSESVVGTDSDTAFRSLLQKEGREHIREAIEKLPERKRTCVLLYYGRDMSLAEIAAVFKVTPSRICQILGEARRDLKRQLQDTVSPDDFSRKELR
ncbi:MAG: FliA/WhiG family RNA polymerase sigma factor [Myxococcota bacterium]